MSETREETFTPDSSEPFLKEQAETERIRVKTDEFFNALDPLDVRPEGFLPERIEELPKILEQAREHAASLVYAKVLPCDVCIKNFIKDKEKALEIGARIFQESLSVSPANITVELLDELYPEYNNQPSGDEGRIRVHGITPEGKYQTYCHFCDDDMCNSEIDSGKNWDRHYEAHYRQFIRDIPKLLNILLMSSEEWARICAFLDRNEEVPAEVEVIVPQAKGYYFQGSTAWSSHVNILVGEGQPNCKYVFFTHEGREWTASISPADDILVRRIGHKLYKTF